MSFLMLISESKGLDTILLAPGVPAPPLYPDILKFKNSEVL